MTDEPGDGRPAGDSRTDAEGVRRLLADARHTGPTPPDVAARMDAVLADLDRTASRRDGADPIRPGVVSLAAQRRRRAAGLLAAAAAIVVGGVVVAQNLPRSGSQSGPSAAAGDRSETDSNANGDRAGSAEPTAPGTGVPRAASGAAPLIRAGRVRVRPQHFTTDALAARSLVDPKAPASRRSALDAAGAACAVPRTPGPKVAATYEGAPAVLVFRPPVSTAQVVDLYLCGSRRPVRSSTLPGP